jgi:hypothetical protein
MGIHTPNSSKKLHSDILEGLPEFILMYVGKSCLLRGCVAPSMLIDTNESFCLTTESLSFDPFVLWGYLLSTTEFKGLGLFCITIEPQNVSGPHQSNSEME